MTVADKHHGATSSSRSRHRSVKHAICRLLVAATLCQVSMGAEVDNNVVVMPQEPADGNEILTAEETVVQDLEELASNSTTSKQETFVTTQPSIPSSMKIDDIDLPFGDVNIMYLSDVYRWINVNSALTNLVAANSNQGGTADLGHALSFYQHVQAHCVANGHDLFLLGGGDLVTSTSSAMPMERNLDILPNVPFDVATFGDADIGASSEPYLLGHFSPDIHTVTTNVYHNDTVDPLGDARFQILKGASGRRLLVLSFMDEDLVADKDNNLITVQKIKTTLQMQWFQDLIATGCQDYIHDEKEDDSESSATNTRKNDISRRLKDDEGEALMDISSILDVPETPVLEKVEAKDVDELDLDTDRTSKPGVDLNVTDDDITQEEEATKHTAIMPNVGLFDAIVIMAHMNVEADGMGLIQSAIRNICGRYMPIQLLSSHNLGRSVEQVHRNVNVLANGRKGERAISFVSLPTYGTVKEAHEALHNGTKMDIETTSDLFQHVFVEPNVHLLHSLLNMNDMSYEEFHTPQGKALSEYMMETQQELGLWRVQACAPEPLQDVSQLYVNEVIPSMVLLPQMQNKNVLYNHTNDIKWEEPFPLLTRSGMFIQRSSTAFATGLSSGPISFTTTVQMVPHRQRIYEITMVDAVDTTNSTQGDDRSLQDAIEEDQKQPLSSALIHKLIKRLRKDTDKQDDKDAEYYSDQDEGEDADDDSNNSSLLISTLQGPMHGLDKEDDREWILYCVASEWEDIRHVLHRSMHQDMDFHIEPIVVQPEQSKWDIGLDGNVNYMEYASIPRDEVTTRSIWMQYIQMYWQDFCETDWQREEKLEEEEETLTQVSKMASFVLLLVVAASVCSSCISCGSAFVFVSIWCQQKCFGITASTSSSSKKSTTRHHPHRGQHSRHRQFNAVNYDSDASSVVSIDGSTRSIV